MSETASIGEIERIAQAIALADGFQLLVLECEPLPPGGLRQLLDDVQHRVAELRGVPPSIEIYNHDLFIARIVNKQSFRDREAVNVLDGTDAAIGPTGRAREDSWRWLFQRINDRRNSIIRDHASTMIFALAPALSRIFLEEAPDMASIRSGVFYIDATLLQANLRPDEVAPDTRYVRNPQVRSYGSLPQKLIKRIKDLGVFFRGRPGRHDVSAKEGLHAKKGLHELLFNLFQTSELYQFVDYNFPDVLPLLPTHVAPLHLARAVVDELGEVGRIDRSLFERLARVRPDRRDEIDEVAQLWGYTLAPPVTRRIGSDLDYDVHERLLTLTPSQLVEVTYLAGLFGDRPMTSRIPARDLVARARSEGPEALARLADAIDLVTARD